ncbi:mating-type switching protein swi1 [Apiospora hydei]|uniref:Topoisomerase 1-associated factor 1 n=1 Tax=Apiospora hydei TaxID=1337664 RepID=A0ABR1V367_9PEZI
MEASEGGPTDVVHPEVRAHINSLVSALGGFSADDDGRYVLGDSALEVLRDIKKWIRFYDEKTNRMDVARCLAEANLIDGDLLHILATWSENANDNKFKARVALACIEILVPLSWPLDRNKEEMTVNHHRHIPVLQLAQLAYKRSIINFDAAQILHTAVRVALPSLAIPRNDRSTRDEGIIKLVLLFLRNIAMISPPPGVTYDGDESQISRSALIDALSYQDILLTILTIASNMGEDFNQEGLVVMEIIFHLVKRVNISQLFMDDKQVGKAKSDELTTLMQKEAAMHRSHNRKAPTRHSRWGSMLWVKRDDGKVSTISGQDALVDAATREQKMDSSKVYRPPRRPRKEEMEPKDLGPRTSLNSRAREQLRGFVEEFLDSGFNPLFMHVRKKLDEQKDYVFEYHHRQFFYLTSWFLEAERVRQKVAKKGKKDQNNESDVGTFNLVAGVLNQETFITLNRAMGDSMENKNWPELSAAMRCFTQILLTVQEMTETGNEEDEEIAENILGRIFYENETHERIATIARNFKDQGFEFLDACTELTHTYLRVLEAYSKQNVDMQVRSRRRTRKNKKAAKAAGEDDENPVAEDESENDEASAEKTSTERKFQFGTFTNKFTQQGVVDTFVHFTKFYHDLNDSQLKRAHRYFYRIAFKQNMSVMLFRVDIIHLFYNIIKGQEPLDKQCSAYKEWDELVKQILKKCIRKIEERPALLIEMLFSKINATAHYLEYGYEKQTISSSKPRSAAELEFRHIVDHDKQVAIAVGVLLDKELSHHIKWVKSQLAVAETERRAWEIAEMAMPSIETPKDKDTAESADQNEDTGLNENRPAKEPPPIFVRPDDDARRTAMFKNSHLRLLMKLVGFQRLDTSVEETPKSEWIVPSSYTADQLQESIDLINKAEFDPPTFEDGALAENQLRRKTAPRKKAVFDDEDENDGDEDENLFPAGGPTVRKVIDENGEKPRKIRKRRRRASNSEPLDDEELEEKARKRRERELEKARRFKSDVYVHASDDETDDERDREFFANEERLRQKQKALVVSVINNNKATSSSPPPKATSVKRKAQVLLDDDSENDDLPMTQDSATSSRGRRRVVADDDDDEDEASTSGTDDTPVSSGGGSPAPGAKKRRRRMPKEPEPARPEPEDLAASLGLAVDTEMADADGDEEEEDVVSKQAPRRRAKGKAGFIIDSSDEE